MKDILNQIKKSEASVPDGYFDTLSDKIMDRVAKEEKVEEILDSYATGQSGSVPDGYFDQLPNTIMERVRQEESHRIVLRKRWITVTSVAASIALVVSIGSATFFSPKTENPVDNRGKVTAKVETPLSDNSQNEVLLAKNTENTISVETTVSTPVHKSPKVSKKDQDGVNSADEFIDNYEYTHLDVMDYEILEYFSDDDFISEMLDS